MQELCNKDMDHASGNSVYFANTCSPWWNVGGLHIPGPFDLRNFTMKTGSIAEHTNQVTFPGLLPEQDSSSTQSTGQSCQAISSAMKGSTLVDQSASTKSGEHNSCEKWISNNMRPSDMSLGKTVALPSSPVANTQPFTCISYAYANPCFEGALKPYGLHNVIPPPVMGVLHRIPLPMEDAMEEQISLVNSKQYHAIMRRRQVRAKQEAQNKLPKGRKPYLHESRHNHAMKRARGSGGRFLNTKQLQEKAGRAAPACTQAVANHLSLHHHRDSSGAMLEPELFLGRYGLFGAPSSTPSGSEVTSASDEGNMFQQQQQGSLGSHDVEQRIMRLNGRN